MIPSDLQATLRSAGASQTKPLTTMKRALFFTKTWDKGWDMVRIRDEGEKITMAFKSFIRNGNIKTSQKELEMQVSDFETAVEIMELLGFSQDAYQVTKRETWMLGQCQITIDHWPFIEPLCEIEGSGKPSVVTATEKLGFDYNQAYFGPTGQFYKRLYSVNIGDYPRLDFDMENPFI